MIRLGAHACIMPVETSVKLIFPQRGPSVEMSVNYVQTHEKAERSHTDSKYDVIRGRWMLKFV